MPQVMVSLTHLDKGRSLQKGKRVFHSWHTSKLKYYWIRVLSLIKKNLAPLGKKSKIIMRCHTVYLLHGIMVRLKSVSMMWYDLFVYSFHLRFYDVLNNISRKPWSPVLWQEGTVHYPVETHDCPQVTGRQTCSGDQRISLAVFNNTNSNNINDIRFALCYDQLYPTVIPPIDV